MVNSVGSQERSSLNAKSPSRFLISELCELLESYLEPVQVKQVYRAYLFSAQAHEGQTRLTGEPYIYHPLAVAKIMAEMRMDAASIIAAILHDVIEDTPTAKEQIMHEFGEDIAELVDGVSKLTHLKFKSKAEAQAENFRKMMLAMVRDIRVIIVKLADRIHNMRTIDIMHWEKRRRIGRETLDIYVPIAQRLGMNKVRMELERLAFQALYPMRYRVLDEAIRKGRGNRKEIVQGIETSICSRLEEAKIESRIFGREKSVYSLYKKMRDKHVGFHEVFDVFAIRVVVEDVDTCYRALGVIHNLYKPVPGRFKDYIAIPKKNGYQSLHTILLGPHGVAIEVQIRTQEMEHVAESGVAAHWIYKSKSGNLRENNASQQITRDWVKGILELQQSAGNSLEFLENIKVDLFPDEIYVFTPRSDIIKLPRGATVVDFAYAVHSDIGNSCVSAKIDRRLAPLSTRLENGQSVDVLTSSHSRPNPLWLNFAITAKARSNIRQYLKQLQSEEAVELGKRLFEKSLSSYGIAKQEIANENFSVMLASIGLQDVDELYCEIGLGKRFADIVVRTLMDCCLENKAENSKREPTKPLAIDGTEGLVVSFSKCCHPIPGDNIVGMMTAGKGLVIHTESCRNLDRKGGQHNEWMQVSWSSELKQEFTTEIRVQTANQTGMLATVANRIADHASNIENIVFDERDGSTTTINFLLTVRNRRHLAEIMRSLRKIPNIFKVARVRG